MNKNHGEMAFLPERKNEQMSKSDWNMKNLILERKDQERIQTLRGEHPTTSANLRK